MRNGWNHFAPRNMQPLPADNTSEYVWDQVAVWRDHETLIHTQIAMEIASWWQDGGNSFAQFASTGTITEDLLVDVKECIRDWEKDLSRPFPVSADIEKTRRDLQVLRALRVYLEACTS